MANKYPPYVNAYNKVADVFIAIKSAAVPTKFNQDYLHTILGLGSSSYHAMIPLLKRLDFLDANNQPTQLYKEYRDETQSKHILAQQIKVAYEPLFKANEFAHKLNKEQVTSKLKTILGAGDDDTIIPNVVGTFLELVKLADFDDKPKNTKKKDEDVSSEKPKSTPEKIMPLIGSSNGEEVKFGISYTINLNLPATTEIEVFNAIFRSLKENLLK